MNNGSKFMALLFPLSVANGFCGESTRLQVLVTSSHPRAEAVAERLNQLGAGPAEIRAIGGNYKVVTKPYATLAEANFVKPRIRDAGFPDLFAVADADTLPATGQAAPQISSVMGDSLPSIVTQSTFDQTRFDFVIPSTKPKAPRITDEQLQLDNNQINEDELFAKGAGYWKQSHAADALETLSTYILRFPEGKRAADALLLLAYWQVKQGMHAEALQNFQAIALKFAGSELAGEATLRIGYLQLRQNQDNAALQSFHSVGSGKVPAAGEVRLEAMLRTAAMFHRGRDLARADASYAAVEAAATLDHQVRAFAAMHRAALALENAWNGIGSFADAAAACDSVLMAYPNASQSIRATAAIMAIESLCYQHKYSEALSREKSIIEQVTGTPEAALAYYWIAKARLESGDPDGALNTLQLITTNNLPDPKRFKNLDIAAEARQLAARAYDKLGQTAKADGLWATK